jgi:hypothetical protein
MSGREVEGAWVESRVDSCLQPSAASDRGLS